MAISKERATVKKGGSSTLNFQGRICCVLINLINVLFFANIKNLYYLYTGNKC
jgi:hypothetical protein